MAVTVVSTPDPHALTLSGRMLFGFQGAGPIATTGIRAVSGLAITGAIADGTAIRFSWNGKTVTCTARTNPAAPTDFPVGNGSAGYVDQLTSYFASFFPFREDFVVTRGQDAGSVRPITFTAKTAGPQFNFALTNGAGYTLGVNTAGADITRRPQYSVYVELWVKDLQGPDYTRRFSAPIETDATGLAQFDAGPILHSELQADLPSWNLATIGTNPRSARPYYVCYGEAYGSPLQIGRMYTDLTRFAYLGGADFLRRSGSGMTLASRSTRTIDATHVLDSALRYGANTRYVRMDEPQYLTFVNTRQDAGNGGVLLQVQLTMTDASTVTAETIYARQPYLVGSKLTYPVGVAQLQLARFIPEGKTLQEYSCRLVSGADVSVAYRYLINTQYEANTRYFAYINSLGAIDTLATFGKGSHELQLFSEQAERHLPAGYDIEGGQFVAYDLQLQQQTDVATGYRSKAELRGWADFYRSPQKFHLRSTQALPIGVVSKSIKQHKDGDTLYAHSFQFQYLFRDDFYTVSAEDEAELAGDSTPPPNFTPPGGGTVVIQQPVVVNSVDATVPNVVRTITPEQIQQYNQAVSWGNHTQAGYLTPATGALVFRRADQKIDFVTDLLNRPNSRDSYGITDVPTNLEAANIALNLFPLRAQLSSWTDDIEPA